MLLTGSSVWASGSVGPAASCICSHQWNVVEMLQTPKTAGRNGVYMLRLDIQHQMFFTIIWCVTAEACVLNKSVTVRIGD